MIPDERNLPDPDERLAPGDARFLSTLLRRTVLGDETVDALESACPPVPVSTTLKAELGRVALRATAEIEFEARMQATRQTATLGTYVFFLRGRAGLSVSEAAKKYRLPFQWLADLERNALSPREIPARRLADLLRRMHGSLEQTERLLLTTIQTPQWVAGRDSLYRGGSAGGRRWVDPPDPSEAAENPDYADEADAVEELRAELRKHWGTRRGRAGG
ncbi:MAG: hypothetical protein K0Q72_2908 [Armatimonadetes bacterium]|nr:hypothetical protein [Armatimonadota bacterium]